MHSRNCHLNGYDFVQLASAYPPLEAFMAPNPVGKLTIDFAQPKAVKALNGITSASLWGEALGYTRRVFMSSCAWESGLCAFYCGFISRG